MKVTFVPTGTCGKVVSCTLRKAVVKISIRISDTTVRPGTTTFTGPPWEGFGYMTGVGLPVGKAVGAFVRVAVAVGPVGVAVEAGVIVQVGVTVEVGAFTVKTAPATGRPVTCMGFAETWPWPVSPVAPVEKVPEAAWEKL